jgi:tRNA(fMet)-specific endonuclease VapC
MVVVLDTNHFTELVTASASGLRLVNRLEERKADVFTCIIAAEESLQGWIAFIRGRKPGSAQLEGYRRLKSCIEALNKFTILPFDLDAANLFSTLQSQRLRIGTMDMKIAAICVTHDAVLLSRNLSDFKKVPSLRVENWLD